ncbi:MAG: PorT family protein [Cytophagales bacterium]|nr:MAG: PorT family protein [Cytophagales bacterium]
MTTHSNDNRKFKIRAIMKQLTLIILTITAFNLYGQDNPKKNPISDFRRVQIGINISPDICFRTVKINDGNSSRGLLINLRNDMETIKVGYTVGLNVCFNIKKFVGLETGIQYSNKGYQTKKMNYAFVQPEPSLPEQLKLIYNFHYIDIPLKVNFTIGKKKVRFFTSVGLVTNILIKETETSLVYYSDHTDKKINPTYFDYNKVNISPTISAGIDYKINNRMNLRVEPTFRYGVLKIIDEPVTEYLYSSGLNISYYFGL